MTERSNRITADIFCLLSENFARDEGTESSSIRGRENILTYQGNQNEMKMRVNER
jgi:hypothetical protein